MSRFRTWTMIAATAVLAACASKPEPAPQPAPAPPAVAPVPSPPPPPAGWEERPLSDGEWVYRAESGGSRALFGPSQSEASFVLSCEEAGRRVVLSLEGRVDRMTVRTTESARTLAATPVGEQLPYSRTSLAAGDPLLDTLVFSRGRFAVEAPGLPTLVLPVRPEPARVVEDCRG